MNALKQARHLGAAAMAGFALVCGTTFLSIGGAPASGMVQDTELPSAQEVVDKYIEATGGREAYEALESQTAKGSFEMPMMEIKGTMQIFQQAPDKMLVIVDIPDLGQIRRGVNGDVGWMTDPMSGTRLLTENERSDTLRDADPNTLLDIDESYESVEVKGVEDVKGEEAYHLVFTPKGGGTLSDQYFSVESGLLVKTAQTETSPMGEIRSESFLSDYKEVSDEGLRQPHRITAASGGVKQVMTIEEAEVNVDIPAERFEIPDDVKQLLEKEQRPQE